MVKKYLFFVMLLLILPSIIAVSTLGTYRQNTQIELIQICDNCSYVNLSTITFPNTTIQNVNIEMSAAETTYNYSFTKTQVVGDYIYTTCGNPDGVFTCQSVDFKITASGNDLGTAESIIYIIFLGAMVFTFLIFLYGAIKIPFRNTVNDNGQVVSVNDLKYFKVILIVFSYLTLMAIFGIMRQITANYLFLSGAHKTFQWMFWFMLSFTFPAIVVSLILLLILYVESKKIKNALERGVPFR